MEPRTTSRLQRKEAAFEVKAEGNERFRNGRLRSALECYEEASTWVVDSVVCACMYVRGIYSFVRASTRKVIVVVCEIAQVSPSTRSHGGSTPCMDALT